MVGFARGAALLALVRLSTESNLFPLTSDDAFARVDAWLGARRPSSSNRRHVHVSQVQSLLAGAGTAGNTMNDAHLAAHSIEHRDQVQRYDSDLDRFDGVGWSVLARRRRQYRGAYARVVELADTGGLNLPVLRDVWVRIPPRALHV